MHDYRDASGTWSRGPSLNLDTFEISQSAMAEIAQLSFGAAPFDLFLRDMIDASTPYFVWNAPLGHVRETRTALSGLFGRFVARAYLQRYHNFAYFEPVRSDTQSLRGWPSLSIKRKSPGDLPDWIIASKLGANQVAIAEAKGSHDKSGYENTLERAEKQVNRIDVLSGGTPLRVKRFAVASRWAIKGNPHLAIPWLAALDPEEGEREPTEEERRYLVRSVALGHFASLARGFGLSGTADVLLKAKTSRPGSLDMPKTEQLLVNREDRETAMIGALATPIGVLPIPPASDLPEYVEAVRRVFDDRVLFYGVDVDEILRVDADALDSKIEQASEGGPPEQGTALASGLLERPLRYADRTETAPVSATTVRRAAAEA